MPLYGYKKDATTTVVGAALNAEEFTKFYEAATELFSDKYMSDLMMHLTDPEYQGFQANVAIFEHTDIGQQAEFIEKHEVLIGTRIRCIDRNTDMVNYDKPDEWLDVRETRTIAQLNGLTEETDKWDKRTEEEKNADKQMKQLMDEMRKKGELSNDDSFTPVQNKKKDDGSNVHVTDIRTSINADGSINIDNVLAAKTDDELTNAVLDLRMGDYSERVDVNWKGRDIEGADQIINDVYFGDKHRILWATCKEPVFTVTTRDGQQRSGVEFVEILGELITDHALDSKEAIDNAPRAPSQSDLADDDDGGEQSLVDSTNTTTHESFRASPGTADPTNYLFAFYRGEGSEDSTIFAVVEKGLWASHRCLDDQHVSTQGGNPALLDMPYDIGEEMTESEFVSQLSEADARVRLLAMGLTESQELDDFLNC